MTIVHPDWISGLLGGMMIGLAGAIFLLGNGRIMGASGILGRVLDRSETQPMVENIVFLLALVLAPVVFSQWFATGPTHLSDNWLVILSAGLLVGIGTRLANGCTSGHGVCGISRLSPRGIVSTFLYIAAGGATIALLRHIWGLI
ncbi:YeeE/YedE family protein [Rhodobacteraceae bacterium nBUS_24]